MDKPSITYVPVLVVLRQTPTSGVMHIHSVVSSRDQNLLGQEVYDAADGGAMVQVYGGMAKLTDPVECEARQLLRELEKLIANNTLVFSKTPDHGTRETLRKVQNLSNPAIPMDAKLKAL